ncbi:exodeoxyribonuclease III, partial [Pseudomonas sp. MWU12-2323]|nr:exodeoxyribonuclease III [Pseudomonas sp. MWU12-2323]
MLRIVSANLNGVRSADKKGFFDWLAGIAADFVCVQELKAQAADLSERMRAPDGLTGYFHYAEKKGYSGVGVYTRHQPDAVIEGLGVDWIDAEGRFLQLDFGNLSVISLYLPSGSSSDERQQVKFQFLDVFMPH